MVIESFKRYLSRKTLSLRHNLVRIITPQLYLAVFPRRPMIEFIRRYLKGPLVGVELGVCDGRNAYNICMRLNIKKLYLVDPYVPYYERYKLIDPTAAFHLAKLRLRPFRDKVVFIKKPSAEAVDEIPDELDFTYIDACHDFDFVSTDIRLYFKKTGKQKVLGGHDYGNLAFPGVKKAVDEFVKTYDYKLYQDIADWWIIT